MRAKDKKDKQEVTAIDPLWANVAMPLEQTFYPLGFPLQLSSNSPVILEAAQESWPASACEIRSGANSCQPRSNGFRFRYT